MHIIKLVQPSDDSFEYNYSDWNFYAS